MELKKLLRYLNGDSDSVEKIEVFDWIHKNDKNMRTFIELRRFADMVFFHDFDSSSEKQKRNRFIEIRLKGVMQIAAVLCILLSFSMWIYKSKKPIKEAFKIETVYVPKGEVSQLTLSDSTQIWINSESTIHHCVSNSSRKVKLTGGAFFDVKHKTDLPFVVELNGYSVVVHGTQFNVESYPEDKQARIALLKGSIELVNSDGKTLVNLVPNQEAKIENNQIRIGAISNIDYHRWYEGLVVFDNLIYGDIFTKLQRYFNVKIVFSPNEFNKQFFTGKFRKNDGIEHVLNVLKANCSFEYKYDKEKQSITIIN